MTQHFRGGRLIRTAGALLCAGLASSCVSKQQYDEALVLVKQYQTDNFDLNAENTRLRQENDRLMGQLRSGQLQVLDSSYTGDVERRLEDLQGLLNELGRPPGDIERFDVEGGYLYMIQDKLLFESGKADLGEEGRSALRQIAKDIAAAAHGTVFVRGHTDSDPVKKPETVARFPHGNIQLSAERAVAVAALLIETKDIPEKQIRIMGFGPHEPVVPNDGSANKRLNRRVEIFVANPGS